MQVRRCTRRQKAPRLNEETDGSMWTSLIANLRDAFNPVKQAPLNLESKPIESDLVIEDEGIFASLKSSIADVFFPRSFPLLFWSRRRLLFRIC